MVRNPPEDLLAEAVGPSPTVTAAIVVGTLLLASVLLLGFHFGTIRAAVQELRLFLKMWVFAVLVPFAMDLSGDRAEGEPLFLLAMVAGVLAMGLSIHYIHEEAERLE